MACVALQSPRPAGANRLCDSSPDMPSLQLSLDAGDARLFLLPAETDK